MKVRFKEWDCIVLVKQYPNRQTALHLIDAEDRTPVAMATVNIPGEQLNEGEVIIKDYSENEGILDALVGKGIISNPLRTIRSGFVELYVCKLLRTEDDANQN